MLGVAIMTVVLGGGLLAFRTLTGGDEQPQEARAPTTPALVSTAVLSAAPSATPVAEETATVTSEAPAPEAPEAPAPEGEATAVPEPGPPETSTTAVSLPNRFDCNAIRGTAYRSQTERAFFEANCQTLATARVAPASAPPAIATQAPAEPAATTPPPPLPPASEPPASAPPAPSNPVRDRLISLTSALTSASATLAAHVNAPNFSDAGWLERARASAQQVENLTGAISAVEPPSCLRTVFSTLRAAASEISTANGFISSGLDAADPSLLQTGAARLAAGRASLSVVPAGLASASC